MIVGMRYITATLGALFIFLGVILVGFIANRFLPPALQQPVVIPLGTVSFWCSPSLLVGLALGTLAAVHSFRSTLSRSESKSKKLSETEPAQSNNASSNSHER
jgi:hypothetical protein